jgi:hypothetical protein
LKVEFGDFGSGYNDESYGLKRLLDGTDYQVLSGNLGNLRKSKK